MSNKEFELKFLPTKACLESRLSQEFGTDTDYVFRFFTKPVEATEETKAIPYIKSQVGDGYIWGNKSADFYKLETGNSLAAQVDFLEFPEVETNSLSPGDAKDNNTNPDRILLRLSSDSLRTLPNDANGIFFADKGSNVSYAGTISEIVEMWPTAEFFTTVEKIAWENAFLGCFVSETDLLNAIATQDEGYGYLNINNSHAWSMVNSTVEMVAIGSKLELISDTFNEAWSQIEAEVDWEELEKEDVASATQILSSIFRNNQTSFEDVLLRQSGSETATIGGVFLANGTTPDDLILYASPFYKENAIIENIEIESALDVSGVFFTDIIII